MQIGPIWFYSYPFLEDALRSLNRAEPELRAPKHDDHPVRTHMQRKTVAGDFHALTVANVHVGQNTTTGEMPRVENGVVYVSDVVPRNLGEVHHGYRADGRQLAFYIAVGQMAHRSTALGLDRV